MEQLNTGFIGRLYFEQIKNMTLKTQNGDNAKQNTRGEKHER